MPSRLVVGSMRQRGPFPAAATRATRLALLVCLALCACQEQSSPDASASAASSAPPPTDKLPIIKDDTKGLLLTWVDDKGEFHTTESIAEVPEGSRQQVRVAVKGQPSSLGELLFVADLTKKQPSGAYAVSTMSRDAWDELGAKLRKVRLEALAPSASPSAGPVVAEGPKGAAPSDKGKPAPTAALGVSAIIYGADWCKPCHAAEDYLKQRGVRVVKKDIDESDAARAEMQKKLARIGRGGAPIPVIDVMGQLLVGYSTAALDKAIEAARKSTL